MLDCRLRDVARPRSSWFVFLTLLICYAYFFPRWADWNQNSRLDQVLAIVDQGTLSIDAYYQNTGDYAFFNGHYYSDKAPGTAFLGIPVYWVFKTLFSQALNEQVASRLAANSAFAATLNASGTGLLTEKISFFLALTFVTFFVVAVPAALLGVLFYRVLDYFSTNEGHKLVLTLAYSLATPAFAYANNFYGHQIAAVLLFGAFYLLFRMSHNAASVSAPTAMKPRALVLFAVGMLLSIAVITEYPTGLIAVGLGIYALALFKQWRTVLWMALGGIVPLLLWGAYNFAVYGTPLTVGYEYSTLWQATHRVGFLSLTFPTWGALLGITVSPYRGLFFLSAFLLWAIPGMLFFARERKYRAEFWLFVWIILSFFFFNAASAMWSGGFSVGPRYLVPMLPFLALPIIFVMNQLRTRWAKLLFGLTVLSSFALVWTETLGGQTYPQFELGPLWEYSLPHLAGGDIARNVGMIFGLAHWASLLPLFLSLGGLMILFILRPLPLKGTLRTTSASYTVKERALPTDQNL